MVIHMSTTATATQMSKTTAATRTANNKPMLAAATTPTQMNGASDINTEYSDEYAKTTCSPAP